MKCTDVDRFVQPFADGEFDPTDAVEIENHLKYCPDCQRKVGFELWFKEVVKRSAPPAPVPAAVRDRVAAAIGDRIRRERSRVRWLRAAGAAAAVAAVAVVVLAALAFSPRPGAEGDRRELLVDNAIHTHSRNLPLDIQSDDRRAIDSWFASNLDFGMRVPRFPAPGLRYAGGRLTHLLDRDAAWVSLRDESGRRLSLIAFNPRQADPFRGLDRARINARDVWFASSRGYNVAFWKGEGDVAYSLVSDADRRNLEGVLAAMQE